MNTFANSLFSLLFGWARSLLQRIWTGASSGQFSGFLTWLGDHWLWLAVILCLACTAVDFLIWIIRWRPYLVWRTGLRRLRAHLRGEGIDSKRRFEQGYQGGVALDFSGEKEEAIEAFPDWEEKDDVWSAQEEEAYAPAPEAAPVLADEAPQDSVDSRPRHFSPPQAYEPPPMYAASAANPASFSADFPAARRKRRSQKYERRRADWRDKLINGDLQEDMMLDGLPPVVDREQAFHEPVYPRKNTAQPSAYASWKRPPTDSVEGKV